MNTNCRKRIRSTIKWGGAALTLLLVIVWVGSAWMDATIVSRRYALIVAHGQIAIAYANGGGFSDSYDVLLSTAQFKLRWWFEGRDNPALAAVAIPIWLIGVAAAVPTLLIWHRDRKLRRIGKCTKCGYSRTGLPADRACPECGAAVTSIAHQN